MMTTFADDESAQGVVKQLLGERLIACGTLVAGARSLYRWKEGIQEASETIVLMKTDREHATACTERLKQIHPYEVPEIMVIDPEAVSPPYADWVREALRNGE